MHNIEQRTNNDDIFTLTNTSRPKMFQWQVSTIVYNKYNASMPPTSLVIQTRICKKCYLFLISNKTSVILDCLYHGIALFL